MRKASKIFTAVFATSDINLQALNKCYKNQLGVDVWHG